MEMWPFIYFGLLILSIMSYVMLDSNDSPIVTVPKQSRAGRISIVLLIITGLYFPIALLAFFVLCSTWLLRWIEDGPQGGNHE